MLIKSMAKSAQGLYFPPRTVVHEVGRRTVLPRGHFYGCCIGVCWKGCQNLKHTAAPLAQSDAPSPYAISFAILLLRHLPPPGNSVTSTKALGLPPSLKHIYPTPVYRRQVPSTLTTAQLATKLVAASLRYYSRAKLQSLKPGWNMAGNSTSVSSYATEYV